MSITKTVFDLVTARGIPAGLASLIVAQARHETADFTSNVFRSCNNLFGYKYVGQKLAAGSCTGAPEGGSYARYTDYADSVQELVEWIRRRQAEGVFPKNLETITTAQQYAQLLKAGGYYGDPVAVYTAGLSRFAVLYRPGIGFGGLLIAGAVFWALWQHK